LGISINRTPSHLPRRFPVGATYVIEGYGGEEGKLRVIARYVVLPTGRRINLPGDMSAPAAPRAMAHRRRAAAKQATPKSRPASRGKKIAARRGTG
jgi:hypothetical protein